MFDWTNRQNGSLIGSIGIVSALLQGGYVRRAMSKVGEGSMARRGVSACAVGLVLLALVPLFVTNQRALAVGLLRAASVCMAFTSATVVNSLTAYASLQCDDGVDEDTGKAKEERERMTSIPPTLPEIHLQERAFSPVTLDFPDAPASVRPSPSPFSTAFEDIPTPPPARTSLRTLPRPAPLRLRRRPETVYDDEDAYGGI